MSASSGKVDIVEEISAVTKGTPSLSYEEFRKLYVASKHEHYKTTVARTQAADVLEHINRASASSANATATSDHSQPATQQQQQEEQQPPPPLQDWVSTVLVFGNVAFSFMKSAMPFVLRPLLATMLLFENFSWGRYFALMAALFAFTAVGKLLRSVRLRRTTGKNAAASPHQLSWVRYFRGDGTAHVSTPKRVGYMAIKCVEALLLSISPTYSVYCLEEELKADGIVVDHPTETADVGVDAAAAAVVADDSGAD